MNTLIQLWNSTIQYFEAIGVLFLIMGSFVVLPPVILFCMRRIGELPPPFLD